MKDKQYARVVNLDMPTRLLLNIWGYPVFEIDKIRFFYGNKKQRFYTKYITCKNPNSYTGITTFFMDEVRIITHQTLPNRVCRLFLIVLKIEYEKGIYIF